METLIFAFLLTLALKHAWDHSRGDYQKSLANHRQKQPVKQKRPAEVIHHDIGYWTHQGTHGFPAFRHGFGKGWHEARQKAARARAEREAARTQHLETAADLEPEIAEHHRRQAGARERIREARQPGEGSGEGSPDVQPDAAPEPETPARDQQPQEPQVTPTGGNSMPAAEITYTQHHDILTAVRDDAEAQVNDVRLQRMTQQLEGLAGMLTDPQSLSNAAEIDDALREQQKAAQRTLDAADHARSDLEKDHGGIQEAVTSSRVDRAAQPEYYDQ